MTDNQMKKIMRTMADIECQFLAAVFTFVKRVEDAAGQPYTVAMTRLLAWLSEHGTVEVFVAKDGKILTRDEYYSDENRGVKGDRRCIYAEDGEIAIAEREPYKYTERYSGREKVESYTMFSVKPRLGDLVHAYVSNHGSEAPDVTEYKRVCAEQTSYSKDLRDYERIVLYVLGMAVSPEFEDEAKFLEEMRDGNASDRAVRAARHKSPSGRLTESSFTAAFNQCDDDDDND